MKVMLFYVHFIFVLILVALMNAIDYYFYYVLIHVNFNVIFNGLYLLYYDDLNLINLSIIHYFFVPTLIHSFNVSFDYYYFY